MDSLAPISVADWRPVPTRETIAAAEVGDGVVSVRWSDGRRSPFHALWLRDNCPCPHCVSPVTREQLFEIADSPADLAIAAAAADPQGGGLTVAWSDGHHGRFAAGWLRAHAYDPESRAERSAGPSAVLWGGERAAALPVFDHDAVTTDESALESWLRAVRDVGLTLVRGLPAQPGMVATLARRISFIRESNFGVLFDVVSKPNPDSSAYTAVNLPPHTDLPTRELQPGLQFLHCLVNDATGGDSVFVDGFAIAAALRAEHPADFALLATTPVAFWNKDNRTDYRCSAPIIALDGAADAGGEVREIRCANFLRGPLDAPADRVAAFYRAYRRFIAFGREAQFRVQRRLTPGDCWVFDNRRVLHARTAFDPASGRRHLQGCYVDRDELLSRLRVLQRTPVAPPA